MPHSFNFKKAKISYFIFIFITLLPIVYTSATNFCKTNEECDELNYCKIDENKCVHKKIFNNLLLEFSGLIMIVIGSALSNAGGIGGGGLLIPILLLVLKFYTHEAIPISKLMIFTGAFTSFILGFRQKHPFRNSITIDYNIPLLLVPMLLFGTMVGVTLNKVTPPWLILISLTAVLIINTYKTLKKGVNLYKEENNNLGCTKVLSNTANNTIKIPPAETNSDTINYNKINLSFNKDNKNENYKKEYDFELHSGK